MNRVHGQVVLSFLLSLALAASAPAGQGRPAEEIRISPSADTYVSSRDQDREKNRNFGAKEKLKIVRGKKEEQGGFRGWKGALIRFDLSAIPQGAEIQEARVFLYHSNHEGEKVSIHRMERGWAEMEATWLEPCRGCPPWGEGWGEGNYRAEASDTEKVKKKGWHSWEVTGDVRSFLQGAKNDGWFLKSARTGGSDSDAVKFYSKESNRENRRPYLRVRYHSSPSPLAVKILSPASGAVLHESPVTVTGTVSGPFASLTVNGLAPSISGSTFQAAVPLTEGKNTITAIASDPHGRTASDSIEATLATRGSVAGVVRDSSAGFPLPAALVALADSSSQPHSAWTGADGRYQVSGITSGPFSGEVRKEGYRSRAFSGTVTPGQALTLDLDLDPLLPAISGLSVTEVASNSAAVSWTTDMAADSLVEYGPSPSYGSSVSDSELKTAHKIILGNLAPGGTYHFRVTSRNAYGFAAVSPDVSFQTPTLSNPITLAIASPGDGDTITQSEIRVEGTVTHSLGLETGVAVNGVLAQTYGGRFSANHVLLAEGANPILVKATDVKGNVQTAEIVVHAVRSEHYIRVKANTDSGIAPLEVVLRLDSSLDLAHASLTYEGPGEVGVIPTSKGEYRVRISGEGAYQFTARVEDAGGIGYQDVVGIIALAREEINHLLANKWEGMRAKLAGGDIEGSLAYFDESAQEEYRELFHALSPFLLDVVQEMSDIQLIKLTRGTAIYDLRTVRDGKEYSFQLLFTKDANGIWKIDSF